MLYVSRYSNPELRKGQYTAVRISLGSPRWPLGYELAGEIKDLMPFGLLNKYDRYEDFKREYFSRLDKIGVWRIKTQLDRFARRNRDVVLLCYEDVRKPGEWCHRTAFAQWWLLRTGDVIEELYDPTPDPSKAPTSPVKGVSPKTQQTPTAVQLTFF